MTTRTQTQTHLFDMDAYFERDREEKVDLMKSEWDINVIISEILSSTTTTPSISPPASPILSPASPPPSLLTQATASLSLATNYAWGKQHSDGHWHGELQSNATITAEHIFFLQSLSIPLSSESSHAFKKWLLSEQTPDGSWTLAPDHPGDVSVTVEAYLALKILGLSPSDPAMMRARNFVLERGGMRSIRILTRFFMAMFGLFPWDAVPQTPAELMLLPSYFPVNIYKLSSWARSNVVPLVIIRHYEPIFPLPNGRTEGNGWLDELWVDPTEKMVPYGTSFEEARKEGKWFGWVSTLVDTAVWGLGKLVKKNPLRGYSLRVAKEWILERQEEEGDWAGIVPPMHQGMQALFLCGYKIDDPVMVKGIEAVERFAWVDEGGKRIQSCSSPVWDTLFMVRAISEAGLEGGIHPEDERIAKSVKWCMERQTKDENVGDWKVYKPNLKAGGFAFEMYNTWYPDVDDTAVAIIAFLEQNPASVESDCILAAANWILGMQSSDGGWASFDVDNDKLWLNKIPFSDMDALCDPSTADVTGRILEALGLMMKCAKEQCIDLGELFDHIDVACHRGIEFVAKEQERDGSWYGRWGVNYIYGTSNVLCGLQYFKQDSILAREMMQAGVEWLKRTQNSDGGWGEGVITYKDPSQGGAGTSTASQSAWGLMALLTICEPYDESVKRGVTYLVETQDEKLGDGASWSERLFTGAGFPGHFYLRYQFYSHYFPMMALGRYVKATNNMWETADEEKKEYEIACIY